MFDKETIDFFKKLEEDEQFLDQIYDEMKNADDIEKAFVTAANHHGYKVKCTWYCFQYVKEW